MEHPKIQELMDAAYERWQANDWSRDQFIMRLSWEEKVAVTIGNLNYQVCNGGFMQWHDNGYSQHTKELLEALNEVGTEAALAAVELVLRFVEYVNGEDMEDDDGYEAAFEVSEEVSKLGAQDEAEAVPDILGRQRDAARQQAAKIAKLAQSVGQPGPEAVDVRAALRCRNQVDVAFCDLLTAIGLPGKCPVHGFVVASEASRERLGGQDLAAAHRLEQVFLESARVTPFLFFFGFLDLEPHRQASTSTTTMSIAWCPSVATMSCSTPGPALTLSTSSEATSTTLAAASL